ncbi:MAG: hypothetical protein MPK09_06805 [Gammaproteobacteria bacterium]|nr:hypothetical protein [Gammaproteobacteria bacterium]
MKIQVHWGKPIPLTFKKVKLKGGKTQMDALKHAVKRDVEDCLGDGYGVYVFARRHGDNYYAPLYVGRTTTQGFCKRLAQQFIGRPDLVTYTREQHGRKALFLGTITGKPGQNPEKAIKIVERALIAKCALDAGHGLFNKRNTKKNFDTIEFGGDRNARKISGRLINRPVQPKK